MSYIHQVVEIKFFTHISSLTCVLRVPLIPYSFIYYQNIWWRVQIIQLFLRPSYYLLASNILITLFRVTSDLQSCLKMADQISNPHKIKKKKSFMYFHIYVGNVIQQTTDNCG
jgi:hypothetical protein